MKLPRTVNVVAYTGLCVGALVVAVQTKWTLALILLGIALGFDPFDPSVPLTRRPRWQQLWLYAHLAIVFVFIIYAFGFAGRR